jgi:ABC-type nitrate/sulfonate/bicarbonate transport system substrate-binding protein
MSVARVALAAFVVASTSAYANAPVELPVLMGKQSNLQYLPFFVALGAGYFEQAGLHVTVVAPEKRGEVEALVRAHRTDAFVLSPPSYLRLIDDNYPIVIVANLLDGEAANIVVRASEVAKRGIRVDAPVAEKLAKLQGIKLGIAPGPVTRLREIFTSVGLDADKDLALVTIPGPQQNDALQNGDVDALFCHTPYLERALVDQGAVLVLRSTEEVPALQDMQVHALAFTRDYAAAHRDVVESAVLAIARAEALVHDDPDAAIEAVVRALHDVDGVDKRNGADEASVKRHVSTLMGIYAAAIPRSPRVDPAKTAERLRLFPAHQGAPTLAHVDVAQFFDDSYAEHVEARRNLTRLAPILGAAVPILVVIAIVWRTRKRRRT